MPPSTGPRAAQVELAMVIAPRPPVGAWSPGVAARISASADGYAVDVPNACTTRRATSHQKPGTNGVSSDAVRTRLSPITNSRLAPNWSTRRPISG